MTTAFFRTVILYFVLMLGLRLMGKRQIGELEPSELVLTLLLSDLASVPMQDFGIPLAYGLLPISPDTQLNHSADVARGQMAEVLYTYDQLFVNRTP